MIKDWEEAPQWQTLPEVSLNPKSSKGSRTFLSQTCVFFFDQDILFFWHRLLVACKRFEDFGLEKCFFFFNVVYGSSMMLCIEFGSERDEGQLLAVTCVLIVSNVSLCERIWSIL